MFQWDFSMGVWECPGAAARRWSRLLTEFEPQSVDLPVRAGGRGGDSLDGVSGRHAIVSRFLDPAAHIFVCDGLFFAGTLDDDRELAPWLLEVRKRFCSGASEDLLERLGELATQRDAPLGKYIADVFEGSSKSMRRLERDYGPRLLRCRGEHSTALCSSPRKEAQERELSHVHARSRECGDDGRRPRDRDDREARFDRGGDQFMPGVADAWGAEAVPAEQDAGRPGVFRSDELGLAKHTESAEGDVLKIADRRGDDEQAAQRI